MKSAILLSWMKATAFGAGARGLPVTSSSVATSVATRGAARVSARNSSRGFTLIEVMIAMTIGLIIIVAVLSILASTSRGFKVNDDNAKLADISTLAMRSITNDLSMAGYYGEQNSLATNMTVFNSLTINDCGTSLKGYGGPLVFNSPVVGLDRFSGNGPNSGKNFCGVPAGGTLDTNSPIIQMKYAVPPAFNPSNLGQTAAYPSDGIYLQADPGGAIVFRGSDYATMKAAGKNRRKPDGTDAAIYPYQTFTYFIASVQPNGGGDAVPTLFRRRLDNTQNPPAFVSEPIAEGVERMAINWGFTDNANFVSNVFAYYPQNNPRVPQMNGGPDWSRAVSAEVTLLVRIKAPDFKESPNSRFQVETGNPFAPDATTGLGFRRKILATTIQFRNRAH